MINCPKNTVLILTPKFIGKNFPDHTIITIFIAAPSVNRLRKSPYLIPLLLIGCYPAFYNTISPLIKTAMDTGLHLVNLLLLC
jgi:hypothetical protein